MKESLVSIVMDHTRKNPTKTALIIGDKEITYKELGEKIYNAARRMREYGVTAGSKVILAATSSPAFVFSYFATHLLGAVAIPVDPKISERNINIILEETHTKHLFLADKRNDDCVLIDELMKLSNSKEENFEAMPNEDDIADILFTTGTTSRSKGVVLTHKQILSATRNINEFIGNTSEERELVPLPLSHSFGLGRLRCNMIKGATLIMCQSIANIKDIFDNMKKWKATGFCSVPAGFAILFKLSGDRLGEYADQLRYIEIGSAPMEIKMKNKLMELLPNTRICMHYGLTEASRSCFIEFHTNCNKLNSVGKPSPNVQVKIMDENRNELSEECEGTIFISGNHVMKEYLNNRELTERILKDGWLDTQDYGKIDKDGFVYLKGRKKEIINVGGKKVSPNEVEDYINEIDFVKESACIGVPDPLNISGEIVKAFIVLEDNKKDEFSQKEIISFLKEKVEEYKIPSQFEIIDKVPRTLSGKMQRQLLKNN